MTTGFQQQQSSLGAMTRAVPKVHPGRARLPVDATAQGETKAPAAPESRSFR